MFISTMFLNKRTAQVLLYACRSCRNLGKLIVFFKKLSSYLIKMEVALRMYDAKCLNSAGLQLHS